MVTRTKIEKSGKDAQGQWGRKELSLDVVLGSGVGETLLLAQELQLPLYSDDSILRHWAEKDYKLPSFSTLGFMKKLTAGKVLTESQCAAFTAKMIQINFRTIPIEVSHLNTRLKELLFDGKKKNRLPKYEDFLIDLILGTFLRQFGDTTLNPNALMNLAVQWWVSVLFDESIPKLILPECMQYPSFALHMRSLGGVLSGISATEPHTRVAYLWTHFLWRSYRKNEKSTREAWIALKITCSRIFPDVKLKDQILFELIPKVLVIIIENDKSLNDTQKMSCLVKLPLSFEEDERMKFEKYFTKHKPRFFR